MNRLKQFGLTFLLSASILVTGCGNTNTQEIPEQYTEKQETVQQSNPEESSQDTSGIEQQADGKTENTPVNENLNQNVFSLADIPVFSGSPYVIVNDNVPYFSDEELSTTSFESYSDLDSLGRCQVAYASIGQDTMPTEERGPIGHIKPSGWQTIKYDCVDGKYLYNRCHLIGFQLSAENDNEKNLITGTRYMNVDGMLPFENMVADYVKETGNHVQYRVTPVYDGNNLVASGVLMEAKSVEDEGDGILFNVFCYNAQPGVEIDYTTGNSHAAETTAPVEPASTETSPEASEQSSSSDSQEATYILNTNTKKFHRPDCHSLSRMKEENKGTFTGNREELIQQGYEACKNCNP